jgi:protein-tyrosine phosphatase
MTKCRDETARVLSRAPAAIARRLRHFWALWRARRRSLQLIQQRPRRLLVLCYGNIYRSPFVTVRLQTLLRSAPEPFEIRTAGFHPVPDRPSPPDFVELARGYGVELGAHRSRLVECTDVDWADAIIVMDRYNWDRLGGFGAHARRKVLWLGTFATGGPLEIKDPYSQPVATVRRVVEQMCVAADALAQRLRRAQGDD